MRKESTGKCGFFQIFAKPSSLATCAPCQPHSEGAGRPERAEESEELNHGFRGFRGFHGFRILHPRRHANGIGTEANEGNEEEFLLRFLRSLLFKEIRVIRATRRARARRGRSVVKSSQEGATLTDCSTRFFPDFAGKMRLRNRLASNNLYSFRPTCWS